jgi:acyl dehydratase
VAGDEITTEVEVADISERAGVGFFVFESRSDNQAGERVCTGTWTCIVREEEPEMEIPELRVTPDRYVTYRYAGASGDFNPIHIDDEFARSVGLPGRILHGLWTMAQVARAQTEAAGGPESLRRLSVQFRGMAVPEQEVVVTSTVRDEADGVATVDAEARQGDTRIVRRGEAELDLSAPEQAPRLSGVLTPRQELLLTKVIDGFAAAASPSGSKALAADPEISAGPSTIRNELAVLEELGLLAHPHTSAGGRRPTPAIATTSTACCHGPARART